MFDIVMSLQSREYSYNLITDEGKHVRLDSIFNMPVFFTILYENTSNHKLPIVVYFTNAWAICLNNRRLTALG